YWRLAFSSSFSSKTWLKALVGQINYGILFGAARSLLSSIVAHPKANGEEPNPLAVLVQEVITRDVSVSVIHSEGDEGLDYMFLALGPNLQRWALEGKLDFQIIRGANHTFSLVANQEDCVATVRQWALALPSSLSPATGSVLVKQ